LCGPTLSPLGHFTFGPCFPIGPFPHWAVEVPQIQHSLPPLVLATCTTPCASCGGAIALTLGLVIFLAVF